MGALLRRLRARLKYRHFARELADEIETHRAMAEADLQARGLPADEARPAAARLLGNVTYMREEARAVWIARWAEQVWQDLRHAAVMYRRRPAFFVGATLMLGLGLGLLVTVATFADATFMRPWRVPDPDSLRLVRSGATLGTDFRSVSVPEFQFLRTHVTSMRHLAMTVRGGAGTVQFDSGPERVQMMQVTSGYFEAVGARIVAGRSFQPSEDITAAPAQVAVISERLWTRHFGRDPSTIGRTVRLGERVLTIVGVVAEDFLDGHASRTELWRPLPLASRADPRHPDFPHSILGRLTPGRTADQAAAELGQLSSHFRAGVGLPPITFRLPDTRPTGFGDEKSIVSLVFAALLLVQFVACSNVGNLMLAHMLARQRELAVRLSLGAGRARLVRQLLTEAAGIALAAGAVGLVIVWVVPRVAVAMIPEFPERPEYYTPGWLTVAVSLGLIMTTTLMAGLGPAWRGSQVSLSAASAGHGPTARSSRLRRFLLSSQIAAATVLLVCASLLTRSVEHASGLDPGFAVDEVQQVELQLPATVPFSQRSQEAVAWATAINEAGLPAVALSSSAPVEDDHYGDFLRPDPASPVRAVAAKNVTENYFDVLGIRLVAGRGPRPSEGAREVVISESLAAGWWPGESPLGKVLVSGLRSDQSTRKVVVGVAPELPVRTLAATQPAAYSATENGVRVALLRSSDPRAVDRLRPLTEALIPGAMLTARPLRESLGDSLFTARIGG